jgi:hypothetical protein
MQLLTDGSIAMLAKKCTMPAGDPIDSNLSATLACVSVGLAAEIERYADRYRRNPHANRAPLSSVLKLTPKHFPSELLGAGNPFSGQLVCRLPAILFAPSLQTLLLYTVL